MGRRSFGLAQNHTLTRLPADLSLLSPLPLRAASKALPLLPSAVQALTLSSPLLRPRSSLLACFHRLPPSSLTKTIDAEVEGEMATLKETVNDMVAKLRVFSSEVTRVSLDVGTKGQLGGQAVVTGVEGTWKDRE